MRGRRWIVRVTLGLLLLILILPAAYRLMPRTSGRLPSHFDFLRKSTFVQARPVSNGETGEWILNFVGKEGFEPPDHPDSVAYYQGESVNGKPVSVTWVLASSAGSGGVTAFFESHHGVWHIRITEAASFSRLDRFLILVGLNPAYRGDFAELITGR